MLSHELYVAEKMREFETERLRRVNLSYIARERRFPARSGVMGRGHLLVRAGEVLARTRVGDAITSEPSLAKHA